MYRRNALLYVTSQRAAVTKGQINSECNNSWQLVSASYLMDIIQFKERSKSTIVVPKMLNYCFKAKLNNTELYFEKKKTINNHS